LDFSSAWLLADAVVVAASGIQVAKERLDSLFCCSLSICHASGDVACCSAFSVEKCLLSTSGVENPDFSWTSGVENPDFSSASGLENLDSRSFFVELPREQRHRLVSIHRASEDGLLVGVQRREVSLYICHASRDVALCRFTARVKTDFPSAFSVEKFLC
jgi:hypothetical protein